MLTMSLSRAVGKSKLGTDGWGLAARGITFVWPEKTVPVSVTGQACALNCQHCNRHYLEHMLTWKDQIPAETKSILLSGGSSTRGFVDFEPYLNQIAVLKRKYRINAHLECLGNLQIKQLKNLIDVVSFDFPVSERVIKEVYKLDKKKEDYIESYKLLVQHFPVELHLTCGLEFSKISGEIESLQQLATLGVQQVVLNVFIPTIGTEMAKLHAPKLSDLQAVFKLARELFEKVALGCMRPAGKYREKLDLLALELGFDIIVQPSRKVQEEAEKRNLKIGRFDECCALLLVNNF